MSSPDTMESLLSSIRAKQTVILVHGTYASPKPGITQWYQRGSSFVQNFDAKLAELGSPARCWAHLESVSPVAGEFFWDGENSWLSRSKAALELRRLLRSLTQAGWTCHIVAHSHGGNVVLEALEYQFYGAPLPTTGPYTWFNGKVVLLEPRSFRLCQGASVVRCHFGS